MIPFPPFLTAIFFRVRWLAVVSFLPFGARGRDSTIPLAGAWRFALDPSAEQHEIVALKGPLSLPPGEGIAQAWFNRDLTARIQLPGILQAQGFGNEITPTTPWVLTLGDAWWNLQPASLREHFSQPGHVEVPFLSQPPRHYLGVAWYQRDVEIPSSWKGQHVTLFLERPRWETTVWLDDKAHTPNRSLVAPHVSDLGVLTPGKHRLTIRVDNRQLIFDTANNGHGNDGHSVSDALGATWNGIVGQIELRATSPVWIEDAQVYPNVAKKFALLKVKIGNASARAGSGKLAVGLHSVVVDWDTNGGRAELEVPLGAEAVPWDEFHPKLQHLELTLKGGGAEDSLTVTFGLREITHKDKDLLLNGKPVNLRLNHFGGDFPLTGYPATDVASWKKIIEVCKDYGLNGIRFHSWCPPDAAFTAADELGFYLQPECGMWSPFNPRSVYTVMLEEETALLLKAYGNHPSFILLSPSNEPSGHYELVTPRWAADWNKKDDRRLYSAGTGWSSPAQVNGGAQFAALVRFGKGELRNSSGWFGRDYKEALANVHIPVLSHEVGQWCAYPDFDVINEFIGYLRPSNYNIFKYIAEQTGVLDVNHTFAYASGRFQLACYKEEIEANLRTPGLSGYQLLDLHDYLGQGTALIGLVDAFWNPKTYVTAKEFRRFNSATVPLARLNKRIYSTADVLTSSVELYHFAESPLAGAAPYWEIHDASGQSVMKGVWPKLDLPVGKNIPLGDVSANLSQLKAPAAYKLVVGLKGHDVTNDWNFWVYPSMIDAAVPATVLLTSDWKEAEARLAQGGKVVFSPGDSDLDPVKSPPMQKTPVFWNIQMTVRPPRNPTPRFDAMLGLAIDPRHPALAAFPTDVNCDWQWTSLVANVKSVNLEAAPRELHPIVSAIDDWNRNWRLGVIFECKVGSGSLLVSAIDLLNPKARLGAQQLRRSLLDYAMSDKFRPAVALTTEQARRLFPGPGDSKAPRLHRAFDSDLDDGSSPISVLNPRT